MDTEYNDRRALDAHHDIGETCVVMTALDLEKETKPRTKIRMITILIALYVCTTRSFYSFNTPDRAAL